jgi:hypothetical protein
VLPDDTTHSLYRRTADLELAVFKTGVELILAGDMVRKRQKGAGSYHTKKDRERIFHAATTDETQVIGRIP